MAIHKLEVDDFYDADFSLIAIHCRLEDYRLAYLLNKQLNISLKRLELDLDFKYFEASYSIFEWEDIQQDTTWHLISNVCKKEEDSLQSMGSLFDTTTKVLKTHYLMPELKNVDYLLKIENESPLLSEQETLQHILDTPRIITAYTVDAEQLKYKDYLIF